MRAAFEKALRWIVIGSIFVLPFVPLVVTDSMFFPYITGKNFLFRIVVELMTMAWLALALVDEKYRPKRSWVLGCFAIFVIIMAIADAQGVNPTKSFWSNYERMDGWITIAHLLAFTVVASVMINAEKLWRRLFDLTLGISAYLSVWGFFEVANVTSLGQGSTGLLSRIDATFGNPIYLAIYMLFNIFFAWLAIVQNGKQKWEINERIVYPGFLIAGLFYILSQSNPSSYWAVILLYAVFVALTVAVMMVQRRWAMYIIIVFDTIALLFTGTRGATFGLIGGALLAFLLYAFSREGSRQARQWAIGTIIAIIVLGGGLWAARDTAAVRSVGILDRIATTSLSSGDTVARLYNIEMAWQGIKERPILGWGQENFAIVFDQYYDPRMYAQEQWFDRVHDIIFDWWVAGGTVGLLAYLSILFAIEWVLWRSKKAFNIKEKSILTGLLAGYFIHNLTVFDNITSYILFGTMMAYICWRIGAADDGKPVVSGKWLPASTLPAVGVVCIVLALIIIWMVNAAAFFENKLILSGLAQQPSISDNLTDFEAAIAYNTFGNQEAREQLAQVASSVATATTVPDSVKQQFFDEASQQLLLQEKVSPLDARNPLFLGVMQDAYGDYTDAATSLQQALTLSPKKQSIFFEIGMNQEAEGDFTQAEQTFQQAYQLDTQDTQAQVYYAAAAIRAGDNATAAQLLQPLIASGVAADPSVAQAYAAMNDYAPVVPIWTAYIKVSPTDPQGYLTLAAAYYELKENDQAIVVLQELAQNVPSSADEAQQIIQEIKSGTVNVGQ